jgi:hypothetical protein
MRIGTGSFLFVAVFLSGFTQGAEISFKRTQLDPKFRSEGVAVGDFNSDGKLDISAGSVYYAAPDWKMNLVRETADEFKPTAYSNSFMNFAEDLNGDKRTDLIVVGFPGKETTWFEQPQSPDSGPWKQHVCNKISNNESPQFKDVDGDGQRDLVMPVVIRNANTDDWDGQMAFLTRPADPTALWTAHAISAKAAPGTGCFSHGIGAGDINKDGHTDILCPAGWWEAPADGVQGEWKFHTAAPGQPPLFGEDCAQMYVFDFDGDGDNDVLSSAAHKLGIWWHEQQPEGWATHEISREFSQTHALELADLNSDGLPDFVTGKRFWAHGPKGDIDPNAPAVVFWYELQRKDGKPIWIPHEVDHDSGVGTQFEVADVNGDGLLDIVTSNKKGVYYFEQQRK